MNLVIDVSVLKCALDGSDEGKLYMAFLQSVTADESAHHIVYEYRWLDDWNAALRVPVPSCLKQFQRHWATLLSVGLKEKFVFAGYESALRNDVLRKGFLAVVTDPKEAAVIKDKFYLPEMALSHSSDKTVIFHDTGGLQACIIFRDTASSVQHAELQSIKWNLLYRKRVEIGRF